MTPLTLVFNFKIVLAILVLLRINFRIIIFIFTKDFVEIWVGAVLNLYINLGRTDISIMLSLLIHEHGMSLHQFRSIHPSTHIPQVSQNHLLKPVAAPLNLPNPLPPNPSSLPSTGSLSRELSLATKCSKC